MTVLTGARYQFWRLRDRLKDAVLGETYRRRVFERIHSLNLWSDAESVSGAGSNTRNTSVLREELPGLFATHEIRSLIDAPCGDHLWMRTLTATLDRYIGVDIVSTLVDRNQAEYGSDTVSFLSGDLTTMALPRADAILCRDCLIHLPTRHVVAALANFKRSGARFLLLTSSPGAVYRDVPVGSFRPIDFEAVPFSFPAPLQRIVEGDGRLLALWALADLP